MFRLRPFFECGAFGFDCACPLVMEPPGFFDRHLRLRDLLIPALALLRPGGFFLPALALALPLLSLECQRRLARRLVVDLRWRLPVSLRTRLASSAVTFVVGQVRWHIGMFLERPV